MPLRLEDDRECFVCGDRNRKGLRLGFQHSKKGFLSTRVTFKKHHQGFKNIVHGGLVAAVLDEVMINLAWMEGLPAVTAEMTVRLKRAVPVGEPVIFEGQLCPVSPKSKRLLRAKSTARDAAGHVLATADAKCVRIPAHQIADSLAPRRISS